MLHWCYTSSIVFKLIFMPTIKNRINLTVPRDLNLVLNRLAVRDDRSVSSKALELIERALELEEDIVLQKVAEDRDRKGVKYILHKSAWR
ncbi:hypothetical protein A3E96_03970 [Candidatus Uhrbacteria bacterium RIFCSPHIGHO2_12_FULL_46_13]|uniref:CopG-like ribbon-helix-helix domain-containing protein n=1 Tax=Candidatus Uhrbacteria bacterium RIFCSPLOWO2_01_FULL_47_25 TaxID=1802402 RepID=A0A1F7UV69_9BACT|nr:MAG: hypothetical protein A3E96_03970 [Candidatus Uhrbacteria bacterium RIFCSPHIGHO2_12_FULL_46_13]OGL81634.1 MAG: hypothetical protein A2936_04590 [Candidatus Uhrbacteria bacterium RIFCSPLOWO2_01_FULL_47_25]OGL84801.1 MAG: hypothetical protein A3I37_05240 [Candidatus Uhrbacteria bacterium RIFCSPLOWO2_02_FULL_46_19]